MPFRLTLVVLLALSPLAACDNKEESTSTVHNVQYFLDHPEVRKSTLEECHNNPGQLNGNADCKNASAAERDAFIDEAQKVLQTNN